MGVSVHILECGLGTCLEGGGQGSHPGLVVKVFALRVGVRGFTSWNVVKVLALRVGGQGSHPGMWSRYLP